MALLVLAVLQIAGCGSPEERAQSYYENGMKLFAAHENAKAALELRNAVRLKRDMIEAWKVLGRDRRGQPKLASRRHGYANHRGACPERCFGKVEARQASAACRLLE